MIKLTQQIDVTTGIIGHELYARGRQIYILSIVSSHGASMLNGVIICSAEQAGAILWDLYKAGIIGFTVEADNQDEEIELWELLDSYGIGAVPVIRSKEPFKIMHARYEKRCAAIHRDLNT